MSLRLRSLEVVDVEEEGGLGLRLRFAEVVAWDAEVAE